MIGLGVEKALYVNRSVWCLLCLQDTSFQNQPTVAAGWGRWESTLISVHQHLLFIVPFISLISCRFVKQNWSNEKKVNKISKKWPKKFWRKPDEIFHFNGWNFSFWSTRQCVCIWSDNLQLAYVNCLKLVWVWVVGPDFKSLSVSLTNLFFYWTPIHVTFSQDKSLQACLWQ